MTDDKSTGRADGFSGGPLAQFPRQRFVEGLWHGGMTAVAALLAYIPARLFEIHEGFWGVITAVTVVQSDFGKVGAIARDQLVGAGIGGSIAVIGVLISRQSEVTYAAVLLLSILTCWLLNVPSACRVAAITATIVLLIPGLGTPEVLFLTRISEILWGIIVAVAVLWVVQYFPGRR